MTLFSLQKSTPSELPFAYDTRTTRRTRRLRVTVYPGGRVVVSRPPRASERGVAHFLREHQSWIFSQIERMRQVTVPEDRLKGTRAEYQRGKERARALAHERLTFWNQRYGFTYGRVAIKNMTSRWGSCSAKGNLNFHFRIVDLPEDLLDYLIVHELCHLKEMNHGARFWELVAREIPDYRSRRARLRALYR